MKISRSDKMVRKILAACYPEWKGRKLRLVAAESYQLGDYWSEGSRAYAMAYNLATGQAGAPATHARNPFRSEAHTRIDIPAGVLIVEHQIFCGKDAGVTIYVNPTDMAPLLPGGAQ